MDGQNYMAWVNQRLFPALEATYTNGEKMTLVLDNVPYHHCHSEDYIDAKGLKRADLSQANFNCRDANYYSN